MIKVKRIDPGNNSPNINNINNINSDFSNSCIDYSLVVSYNNKIK